MKNPFAKRAASPSPVESAPVPPPPQPAPSWFLAVSNLDWLGFPPGADRPADSREFTDLDAAVRWLKALECGGSVSDGSRIVREVLPGQ